MTPADGALPRRGVSILAASGVAQAAPRVGGGQAAHPDEHPPAPLSRPAGVKGLLDAHARAADLVDPGRPAPLRVMENRTREPWCSG